MQNDLGMSGCQINKLRLYEYNNRKIEMDLLCDPL